VGLLIQPHIFEEMIMPHVICFGRELPDVEFEYLHGMSRYALIVGGKFVAYFYGDTPPLEAYCTYLSHGRLDRAERDSLRDLRAMDSDLALAFSMGKV